MGIIEFTTKATDPAQAGNKASRLAELANAGFRVPPFFVISPRAYPDSQAAPHATVEPDLTCSSEVDRHISRALRILCPDGSAVAVRSSSAEEDGALHSFAGQFDSFLNVRQQDVSNYVARVWQSASSDHIHSYRGERSVDRDVPAPAVMVQRMVAADTAGVAFAADPVTGSPAVAVIAAGRGLGDSLVSGECQGDTWRVGKGGKIVSRDLSNDADAILTGRQVRKVAALVRKVSKYYDRPQDIEWAICRGRIYLLQSRDITTLRGEPQNNEYAIWDNSNIVESYGGVTTPLTFSVARSAYAEAYRHFGRVIGINERTIQANEKTYEQMIGLIDGRVYYNLLNWYRLLMLTPGFRFNRRFMEQMMGVTQALPDSAVPEPQDHRRFAGLRATLGLLRVSWRMTIKLVLHKHRVKKFHRKLHGALVPVSLQQMSMEQLVDYYEALQGTVIPAWDTPLINDLFCMIFHGALRKICERWLPEELAEVHNDLVCGEAGIISLEPVRRMQRLAEIARGDSCLITALNESPVDDIRQTLATREDFNAEFDEYLKRFGDRCIDELKLESQTVADDPLPLLRVVGQMATMPAAENQSPGTSDIRNAAEQKVAAALRGSQAKRLMFGAILGLARARVRDRENLRFERTRVYGRVRAIFMEIGRQLQIRDVIGSPDDIFYLDVREIICFIRGTGASASLNGSIAARRDEFAGYRSSPDPGRRFVTCGPSQLRQSRQQIENVQGDGDEMRRTGQACSPGIVRGPVRIVRDPRSGNVRAGEILVAERTDPGWVTIFPLVSGMIMERGSLLSHSAIVARELGLPCVVGVENACSWLEDGEWIEINGATGTIRRLTETEQAA